MTKSKKKKGKHCNADRIRKMKISSLANSGTSQVKSNPFEMKITKQKHIILGRKSKHKTGLPGVSRSIANKKRQKTLVPELQGLKKSSTFKDGRIGAGQDGMSLEEKMLQRFALEKKKKHERHSQFNLNDDDELTHLGQSLSEIKHFDKFDVESDDDDDDVNGFKKSDAYKDSKKDSVDDGFFKRKEPQSEKDILAEVIAKSKQHKFEKQASKNKSEELRNKLDDNFNEFHLILRPSLITATDKLERRDDYVQDDYDRAIKEMQFDKTVAPSESKKTEEEMKRKEELKQKKQEEARLQRMMGSGLEECRIQKRKYMSADALDDELDYGMPGDDIETEILSFPVKGDDENSTDNENEDDGEEGEDENGDDDISSSDIGDLGISVEDGDSSSRDDSDDNYSDIDSGNEDDGDVSRGSSDSADLQQKSTSLSSTKTVDLTQFPISYEEFTQHVASYNNNVKEAVTALRLNTDRGAKKGNKEKLGELFAYVWEYCYKNASVENKGDISSLVSDLFELCTINPVSCAECVRKRLQSSMEQSLSAKHLEWPTLPEVIQFKLIKILFSSSDFSHPVVTPAFLLICRYLSQCKIQSIRDIACGLYLCTIIYEYAVFSKRFVPECTNFLTTCICICIPHNIQQKLGIPVIASYKLTKSTCQLLYQSPSKQIPENDVITLKPDILKLLSSNNDEEKIESDNTVKQQLASVAIQLMSMFSQLYTDLPSFDSIFKPLLPLLKVLSDKESASNSVCFSGNLASQAADCYSTLSSQCEKAQAPLALGGKKTKILQLYAPKVEDYVGDPFKKRSKKTSVAKKQREILLKKTKKEMKGAVREIRKDNKFIARVKQKEVQKEDEIRAARVKRLLGMLSNQEGEVRQVKRQKYKLDI